jgi:hypothetical protein
MIETEGADWCPDDMCYDKVLAACPDFGVERSALQEMVEARRHFLIYFVPCHPGRACWLEHTSGMKT